MKSILILAVLIISFSACVTNKDSVRTANKGMQIELKIKSTEQDTKQSFQEYLESYGFEYKKIGFNDSIISTSISPKLDSALITKIVNPEQNLFFETYDFYELSDLFGPFLHELDKFGKNNYTNIERANSITISKPYPDGTSVLGYYSLNDTSSINSVITRPEFRSNMPKDLELTWGFQSHNDSVGLFFVKSAKGISDYSITVKNVRNMEFFEAVRNESIYKKDEFPPKEFRKVTFYTINFELDRKGANSFYKLTGNNISKHLALIIEDKVISSPLVYMAVEGGKVSISVQEKEDFETLIYDLILLNIEKEFGLIDYEIVQSNNE